VWCRPSWLRSPLQSTWFPLKFAQQRFPHKNNKERFEPMLLSLFNWLASLGPEWSFLRAFQYLTLRAVMAAITALLIGLVAGPAVIRRLTALKIGQPIRAYGMQTHLAKSGTPTMGGGS